MLFQYFLFQNFKLLAQTTILSNYFQLRIAPFLYLGMLHRIEKLLEAAVK